MTKRIEDFVVTCNRRLNGDLFVLELECSANLPDIRPGQFVQVKIDGSPDTFLRRPISIHDVDYEKNRINLLIQVAGSGTRKLGSMKCGERLNLIYPLGNSFSIPDSSKKILLAGGGCGVAPLLFLSKYLRSGGFKPEILLGFRSADRIVELDEYEKAGTVYIATEDGSKGEKGFITEHTILSGNSFDGIYCCGPEPMMKAIAAYCYEKEIFCEVSLENMMACGFGVCLCCVVDSVRGNVCTCTEGPVFNINDLKWRI